MKKIKYKKSMTIGTIILVFVLNLGIDYINQNKQLEGSGVTYVSPVDGDTAYFNINGEKTGVRFLAIDTPETVKPNTPVQPFGKEASNFTKKALEDAFEVRLEYEPDNKVDKYGRVLAWVFVDDVLLQELLVEEGLAKVAYIYGDYKYTHLLEAAQERAQEQDKGMWK